MERKISVLIIDDEAEHRAALRSALTAFPYVTVAGEASGGGEAVAFLQRQSVDLVFLDIEMGDVDGFRLARHIQSSHPGVQIVFLTGHVDFAIDGYEYAPVDFLVKPVDLMRLGRALGRVRENQETAQETEEVSIGIPVDDGLEILNVNEILYLEKTGRRVAVVDRSGSRVSSCDSLQRLQKVFEPYGFYRCHQSFLVALNKIRGIRSGEYRNSYYIQMVGMDRQIPLSREKYTELRKILTQRGLTIF